MSHKQQILQVLEKETAICKRLFTLIPENLRDYSPGYEMRTTFELLKYISWSPGATVESFFENDMEKIHNIYCKYSETGERMKWEEFPARMDEQMVKINEMLVNVNDEELLSREVQLPWRQKMMLGEALIETAVKWMTGYKMQLFLYLRMNGLEVDTGDCWITVE